MAGAPYTTGLIAQAVRGELLGPADLPIADFAGIDQAGPASMTFIRSGKYAHQWAASKAAAAIVSKGIDVPGHDPKSRALIVVPDADLAVITLLEIAEKQLPHSAPAPGVHPSAHVDPTAEVSSSARIGAMCIVGAGCKIGDGAVLHPRVTLGMDVKVGSATVLHPGVVVHDRCEIGAQCVMHSNVVIGTDGFGYRPDPSGRGVVKIPHIGAVKIGNGVEIGANSCVDRGKFGATVIGDGTKIDNLCQIAHNCRIGRSVLICGLAGIAGSVTIGDGVLVAGHVGIGDNVTIGPGAKVGAKSGVTTNVPAGEVWSGMPAAPHRDTLRAQVAFLRLSEHLRKSRCEENKSAAGGGA